MCAWTFRFSSSSISKAWKSFPGWQTYFSSEWVGYGYLGRGSQNALPPASPLPQLVFPKKKMKIERRGKKVLKWEPHRWPAFSMVTDNRSHMTEVPFLFSSFCNGSHANMFQRPGTVSQILGFKDPNQNLPNLNPDVGEEQKEQSSPDTPETPHEAGRHQKSQMTV